MSDIQLWQGDCLELMDNIEDQSIDCIICDLPYGSTKCSWDVVLPFEELWRQYERIIKDQGAIILFSKQPFTSELVQSNRKIFRYELIWEKTRAGNCMQVTKQPSAIHENIEIFYKKQPTYNDLKFKVDEKYIDKRKSIHDSYYNSEHYTGVMKRKKDDGWRHPQSILPFNSVWHKGMHPTEKPVELLEWLVKTYTNENDLVLDNCMGSGTTGVACRTTNRNFIGIEIEEKYYKMSKQRIMGGWIMSDITRKEHINRLKAMQDCIKHCVDPNYQCDDCDNCEINYMQGNLGEIKETLAYAIASLETDEAYDLMYEQPEFCKDCISREAVEKITWEEPTYTDALNALTEVREKVRALPSVLPKADVPDNNVGNIYICSCGYGWDKSKVVRHHFCPNCGKAVDSTTKNDLGVDYLGVDAISRAELLKVMDTWDKFGYTTRYGLERLDKDDKGFVPYVHYDDMVKCVKGMPSVTPQSKTGHWIRVTDKTGHLVWECDKCGWQQRFNTNFCPDCGSDNREVEE